MTTPDPQRYSCPSNPPLSTTQRTEFGTQGCLIYGYPSTDGVLIKEANLLDMLFLSLPRSHKTQRSPSATEEDDFCRLLRRVGATLWPSKRDWVETQLGLREMTEAEERVLVYGWSTDGVGVWVSRYASARQVPKDFGRVSLAMNMEEKIEMMKEYGAVFVEDVAQVAKLRDG